MEEGGRRRRTGDERGGCGGWESWAHDDGGEAQDAAVDEAASSILVDEEFADELSHPVCALRGGDCVWGDDIGLTGAARPIDKMTAQGAYVQHLPEGLRKRPARK